MAPVHAVEVRRIFAAGAAGILLAQGALCARASPPSDNPQAGLKLDDPNSPTTSNDPTNATPDSNANTFLGKFKGHLVILNDGHFKQADPAALDGVKFIAFYYSASWCGPCRKFTPKLVNFYDKYKQGHPNFELVFVNDDQDENSMLQYMVDDAMKWPAVRFSDIHSPHLQAKKFCGRGIPCLVLVDDTGKVLADSFVNGEYVGAETVMDAIPQKVSPFSSPLPGLTGP